MNIDLGGATNKGTAMLKLAHQFQRKVLFQDDYIRWFFDEALIQHLQDNPWNLDSEPESEDEKFQRIAYWYVILREKHGDEVIETAIASGCKQILLLGSGYDTRFFRLPFIQEKMIPTVEFDLVKTIEDKKSRLIEKLGRIPQGLTLIPIDFNQEDFKTTLCNAFDRSLPTVYIWQGVSYYLPYESVSSFLEFIQAQMTPDSVFVFDCCSPLMTFKNDRIPGISSQIDKLNEIGEPYQFSLYRHEMETWLKEKGFCNVQILQQNDLEVQFLSRRTLPNEMWYVVTSKT